MTFLDETEEVVGNYDDESDAEHAFHSSEPTLTDSPFPPPINKLPQIDSPSKHSQGSLTLPPIQSITSFTPPTSLNNQQSPSINQLSPQSSSAGHQSPSMDQQPWQSPQSEQQRILSKFVELSQGSSQFASPESLTATPASENVGIPTTSAHQNPSRTSRGNSGSNFPSIYLDEPVWPLSNPEEAILLRHFVQKLAIWVSENHLAFLCLANQTTDTFKLDLCDPRQHFQVEVPKRAGTCPILLNAIFALSARHLSHISGYDRLASNRYHDECLKHLIPMLNNRATISDETLFAATIILRVLEEIDSELTENRYQGYELTGSSARDTSSRPHAGHQNLRRSPSFRNEWRTQRSRILGRPATRNLFRHDEPPIHRTTTWKLSGRSIRRACRRLRVGKSSCRTLCGCAELLFWSCWSGSEPLEGIEGLQ